MKFPAMYRNKKLDLLNQTAKDLVRKKLVPEHTMGFFDPEQIGINYHNWQKGKISDWKCKKCGIVIHGPKDWIIQHVKTHFKREQRENEFDTVEVSPY